MGKLLFIEEITIIYYQIKPINNSLIAILIVLVDATYPEKYAYDMIGVILNRQQ